MLSFRLSFRTSLGALLSTALCAPACSSADTAVQPIAAEEEDQQPGDTPAEAIIGIDAFGQEFTGADGVYDSFRVRPRTIGGRQYFVQTNPWRDGTAQAIRLDHNWLFLIESLSNGTALQPWDVITFPSIFAGTDHAGNFTEGSGMPIAYNQITSVATGFSTNADQVAFEGNATYDTYWTASPTYSGGAPDTYLMVWLWGSGLNPITDTGYNCWDQTPTFIGSCTNLGTVVIAGHNFYRFYGSNHEGRPVVSYVIENRVAALQFDLMTFAQDAVTQGLMDASYHLQSVQAGFEVISGGVPLGVNGFYVHVNP
jgi:hypothetical protein